MKVLVIKTDLSVEVVDKDPNDLQFYEATVGAQVEHVTIGFWNDHTGETGFLVAWVDEMGAFKANLRSNSILTALNGCFGFRRPKLVGDAVVVWSYAEEGGDIPQVIVNLVEAIRLAHIEAGYNRS